MGAWHVASPSEQTPLRMPPTAHTPSLPVTLLPVAEVDRAGESRAHGRGLARHGARVCAWGGGPSF